MLSLNINNPTVENFYKKECNNNDEINSSTVLYITSKLTILNKV